MCIKCDAVFGNYFCEICHMYDNTEKGQFHCEHCGICRLVHFLICHQFNVKQNRVGNFELF